MEVLSKILDDKLQATIEDATKKIEAFDLKTYADDLMSKTKEKIDQEVETGINTIIGAVDNTKELGSNIKECVEEYKKELEKIVVEIVKEMELCIKNKMDNFLDSVNNVKDNILKVIEIVKDLKENIAECNGEFICSVKIIGKLIKAIVEVPISVVKLVSDATHLFDNAKLSLEQCALDTIIKVTTENEELAKKISECVSHKIQLEFLF